MPIEGLMEALDTSRSLIDINETTKKTAEIFTSPVGVHALSGCDYILKLYGIVNKTVTKHLKNQNLSLCNLKDCSVIVKCLF